MNKNENLEIKNRDIVHLKSKDIKANMFGPCKHHSVINKPNS